VICLSRTFSKKIKRGINPRLTLKSNHLKSEIQEKINQNHSRAPSKQPVSAERLNAVNVGDISGIIGEHRAQDSNNLFHFHFSFLLGFIALLIVFILSRGEHFVKNFFGRLTAFSSPSWILPVRI